MKKMTIIASLVALASAAAIATFALRGGNKLVDFQVNAGPVERSVTFDGSESTTVEAVDTNYGIGTTTAAGNKVGVVGWYNGEAWFTFKGVSFQSLMLYHYDMLMGGDARPFSTITGFAISFSGKEEEPEPMDLVYGEMMENIIHVDSGKEYKGLSITPDDLPEFMPMGDGVTISSLTIWYSC